MLGCGSLVVEFMNARFGSPRRMNARNLQDPDDRSALRIEIAHACRSSDDTSRRLKDQKQERSEGRLS